jgi:acetoin utilization deacetylase AcuC-like enzyme
VATPSIQAACKPYSTHSKTRRSIAAKRRMQPPMQSRACIRCATSKRSNPPSPKLRNARVRLDPDTYISSGSREAIYRAAGACVAAVDAVLANEDDMAFCAVRPPGHHAEPIAPMGFCIFNNVAIGALHALEAHRLSRVAVVDFDVHHGNGTQTVAESEPRLMFAPPTKRRSIPALAHAVKPASTVTSSTRPCPQAPEAPNGARAMEERVLPALDAFAPELILVSAGFDAHKADPLAQMELETEDFAWAGQRLQGTRITPLQG